MSTVYERIGGAEGIARLVDAFYAKVLADPELAPFFADTPMERLRSMQREFFAAGTGGPVEYTGMTLRDAHFGRHIRERHFSQFAHHLMATLSENGLDAHDVAEVADRLALYRDDVVDSPGVAD
jgi:hemoglobin